MKAAASKKTAPPPAPAARQVRAVVVCRPPIAHDARRLGGEAAASAAEALAELDILAPDDLTPDDLASDSPDADLERYIAVGKDRDHAVRLPLYGYRGGAGAAALCEREVAPLLARLLAGESSAIIAYGQTGSGKSYTMGTEQYSKGTAPAPHSVGAFCARRVFELARERGVRDLEVSVSVVEIYREGRDKERLFDLQTPERRRIESFESQVSWLRAASPEELQRKLLEAAIVRQTDRTDGNARSSRSHAIFVTQVQFKRQQEGGGGVQRIKARLMLVDLAGSERAALAAANSTSQKQGSGINVGLLYLGMILKELSERGATLNYRLSVLTEILKPALGGGANELTSACNTLVVGCISPLAVHAANTRSTLEFLQQAGKVTNLVRPDVQMLRQQELEAQVEYLQKKVQQLELEKRQRGTWGSAAAVSPAAGSPAASEQATQRGASAPPAGMAGEQGEDEEQPGRGRDAQGDHAAAAAGAAAAVAAAEERSAALERELAAARREAVEQRDRAEAYAAQLRQQAADAAAAAAVAEAAAAPQSAAVQGSAAPAAAAAAAPGTAATGATPGAAVPGAAAAAAHGTPMTAGRPSAAAFLAAASPLLAASRGVADWKADAAAAEESTPAGQRLPLLRLLPGAEEIVCERESHMSPDELAALKGKVERTLDAVQDGDGRAQACAFAEACLYALGAYNKCLGDAITRAEDVEEDAAAERRQAQAEFRQVYEEKSGYMRRASAAEVGLSQYEQQVEDLQRQLAAAQEALRQAQQQQSTPNRWGTIRQLITGSGGGGGGGASPAPARSAGTTDSRRTSHSGSPAASPRALLSGAAPGVAQQLFGSPSRLGQLHRRGSGGLGGAALQAEEPPAAAPAEAAGPAPAGAIGAAAAAAAALPAAPSVGLGNEERQRMTVACARASVGQQDEAAAAAALQAALARKQRTAGDALAKFIPRPPQQPKAEQAQSQLQQQQQQQGPEQAQQAQQAQHGELIKAVRAPGLPLCPGSAPPAGGSSALHLNREQQPAAGAGPGSASHQALWQQQQQEAQAGMQMGAAAAAAVPPAAAGLAAVEAAPAAKPEQEEQQSMEQDVDTPLESPEVSCLLGGGSSSCGSEPAAAALGALPEGDAAAADGAAPCSLPAPSAVGSGSNRPQQLAHADMVPKDEPELALRGVQAQQPFAAEAAEAAAEGMPDGANMSMDWHEADMLSPPVVPSSQPQQEPQQLQRSLQQRSQQGPGEQHLQQAIKVEGQPPQQQPPMQQQQPMQQHHQPQPQRQASHEQSPQQRSQQQQQQQQQPGQEQQQERQAPTLPGPAISVEVPVGRRRGRGKVPLQPFEYCPGSGAFTEPESGEPADPLESLALPAGEPWQCRVLLKGSAVTLEQWEARRMLRPGRCHFCCKEAPDADCRHPEEAFGEVQLCGSCCTALEPDTWRTGETWVSEDPADPGYNWCLMCGGAGVGGTDKLVMCTVCKVQGFCSGCIWRFTQDDMAVAQDGAEWECLLCRPPPKLHMAFIEQHAGGSSSSEPSPSSSSGSSGAGQQRRGGGTAAADAERAAADAAAVAAGLRRSTRQRRPVRRQQQQKDAAGSDSESSIVVLLTDSEAEEEEAATAPEEEVQPARARSRACSQRPASARRRAASGAARQAAGTASRRARPATAAGAAPAAEPAGPGDDPEHPTAVQQPAAQQQGAAQQAGQAQQAAAGRKRHRRLLPQGDIPSPTVDEEAQHMRRMQQQQQQRWQQLGAGRSQLQALQQSQRQSQEDRLRKMLL